MIRDFPGWLGPLLSFVITPVKSFQVVDPCIAFRSLNLEISQLLLLISDITDVMQLGNYMSKDKTIIGDIKE